MRSREGYFGVYFPSCAATREIITKITLEWAHKQFVTRVHTLFYFLHDITNPKMTPKTRIFACHPHVSLARFTFCSWRHTRLAMTSQWPDICDANTWQVISNSLDIDFIHGDIHGRSCKKWYNCSSHMSEAKWNTLPFVWIEYGMCVYPETSLKPHARLNRGYGVVQNVYADTPINTKEWNSLLKNKHIRHLYMLMSMQVCYQIMVLICLSSPLRLTMWLPV